MLEITRLPPQKLISLGYIYIYIFFLVVFVFEILHPRENEDVKNIHSSLFMLLLVSTGSQVNWRRAFGVGSDRRDLNSSPRIQVW